MFLPLFVGQNFDEQSTANFTGERCHRNSPSEKFTLGIPDATNVVEDVVSFGEHRIEIVFVGRHKGATLLPLRAR